MPDDKDDEDWKIAVKVYAGHPISALDLAYQLEIVKQCLRRGIKGIPDAIEQLEIGRECLYLYTDFHGLGQRLYRRTIEGKMKPNQKELINKLDGKKS